MSDIYFLASNTKLKELSNPYITRTTDMGIRCNDINKLGYPEVFHVSQDEYSGYGIKKKYVMGLDFRWSRDAVDHLIEYIKEHMKLAEDLEFWHLWLNESKEPSKLYAKKILCSQLNYEFFEDFFNKMTSEDYDCQKLIIFSKFY